MKLRVIISGCLAVIIISLIILEAFAQWPTPPTCLQILYNNDFDLGLLGWEREMGLFCMGAMCHGEEIDDPFPGIRIIDGFAIYQPLTLPAGEYVFKMGMLLESNSPIRPGSPVLDPLIGGCEAIDPGEWQGEHWGQIRVFWKGSHMFTRDIPNGLPHDTYYDELEYSFMIPSSMAGSGDFKIQLWSPAWCSFWHNEWTRISYDWVSLCQVPQDTPTPTVTGTPPDTPTPTPTSTAYCVATDYPTATPYPTSTPYPTATDWLTPPMFFTPTPYPTLTPYPTCPPTITPTSYASPTPFHFNVPLTYTGSFDDLKDGVEDFVDSTSGLLDDTSDILITASNGVSDVLSFAVTNTVVISGTPTASSDLVIIFTSHMSGLSHLLGWFTWLRDWKPTVYWFLLACLAWTILVFALKFGLAFFLNVLWPLAKAIWDIVVDIWNAIPFI